MMGLLLVMAFWQAAPDCGKPLAAGLEAYGRKDYDQALILFRTAMQCDPKLVSAPLALANLYAERGNDGEALGALLQVLRIDPKNVLALRASSYLYLKNGLHNQALPLLESLTMAVPEAADGHADLAAVYAAGGKRVEAEREFKRALELEPKSFAAVAGLGNVLARAGEHEAAMPLLRKAIALQPRAYEGHFLLGSALNRLGQFEEASAELEAASKLGGENEPQVFYQLARAWGGLGKATARTAALARFSELTKREKESVEGQRRAAALIDEARVQVQAGDLENAAQRLEMARELKPGDATLLFRLAGLNFDLERYGVAREYAQTAISISPATWLYHYLLGLVDQKEKRWADAKASLEVAAKLGPTEAAVFNALGEVLTELRDQPAAAAAFERAVKLAPVKQ